MEAGWEPFGIPAVITSLTRHVASEGVVRQACGVLFILVEIKKSAKVAIADAVAPDPRGSFDFSAHCSQWTRKGRLPMRQSKKIVENDYLTMTRSASTAANHRNRRAFHH